MLHGFAPWGTGGTMMPQPNVSLGWLGMLGRGLPARLALVVLAVLAWPGVAPRAQDPTELLLRLDRLEAENRRLNGQVEEMRFQLRRQEDQFRRFQLDAEARFRELEGGARPGNRPAAAGGQAPTTPSAGAQPALPPTGQQAGIQPAPQPRLPRRQDAFDPDQNPNAPGAPRPLGQAGVATPPGAPLNLPQGAIPPGSPPARPGDPNAPLDVSGVRPSPGPAPVGPAIPGDARSEFDFARALIGRGEYEAAEAAFRDFLKNHPRDRRVADATFWLGESYLARTRHREAAEQFLTVTTKYAKAGRAAEAMLKLGISLRGLGANAEACGTFDQVARKYPNAAQNIMRAVEREKMRAQC